MQLDRDDLVDRTVKINKPTVCLDTCSILDLARDPARKSVTLQEQMASLFLLRQVERENLRSVISDRVVEEFERNIDKVQEETEASVRSVLNSDDQQNKTKLQQLASIFGVDSLESQQIISYYAEVSATTARKWLTISDTIKELPEDSYRANYRVLNDLAPSHRARDSFADCVILESYLGFAEGCRDCGLPLATQIVFVSSNVSDFTRFGEVHRDIARSFDPRGVDYAANMYDASGRLFPN